METIHHFLSCEIKFASDFFSFVKIFFEGDQKIVTKVSNNDLNKFLHFAIACD